jgi:hypothetical protein
MRIIGSKSRDALSRAEAHVHTKVAMLRVSTSLGTRCVSKRSVRLLMGYSAFWVTMDENGRSRCASSTPQCSKSNYIRGIYCEALRSHQDVNLF